MGRERISMKLIQNEKSRKTTFEKRKKGLMKKANELSILCDVDVCVILYKPNSEGQGFAEPEMWPKDTNEVQRILQKYYNTTIDRRPKVYHLQEYFEERLKKVEFEISKVRKQRLKIKYPAWDEAFESLRGNELKTLISTLDSRFASCCQKMDMLKGKAIVEQSQPHPSTCNLISNPSVNNMFEAQIYPPSMNISDKTPMFWPLQEGQSSQPSSMISSPQTSYHPLQLGQCSQPSSMSSSAQDFYQTHQLGQSVEPFSMIPSALASYQPPLLGQSSQPALMISNAHVSYQPLQYGLTAQPSSMISSSGRASYQVEPDESHRYENGENLSPYCYNGNTSMQSYPVNPPHGFQHNGITDMDVLQDDMFNYMDERN
ncbi:unnamed protein product [Lathyrus sativus]|nr:unnamed protein product [Lathyrus sativus]